MKDLQIDIRPAQSWSDYIQCEELQRQVWPTPDSRDVVPAHLLITAHKNGGLLLGAFDEARMVGFAFGFLGQEAHGAGRRLKHCSHMLGVLPAYRGSGLGRELKVRQRQHLLAQELELATWTYDPLQAVNAILNLARLGAIARRYLSDAYGEMLDPLNAGVPSDRFEVEWWLDDRRVHEHLARTHPSTEGLDAPPVYEIIFDDDNFPRVVAEAASDASVCRVEIPVDYTALKARNLPLAREWRYKTRATFQSAFTRGYVAVDVLNWADSQGRRRAAYILSR